MSKVDAQRAMREARYAAQQAQPPSARRPAPPPEQPTAEASVETLPTAGPPELGGPAADSTTRLCGHRSISNKTCQREAGHSEKAHRYK